jgi:hypothetical protein
MMRAKSKRKFKVRFGEAPIPSIKAILQIVLSLDQLHGLTRATFPSPIRDDLEL